MEKRYNACFPQVERWTFLRRIARLAVCVALTALTAAAPAEAALPPMMGTDDVHQGMHGKAYTVVDSSGRIRSFDVSVTGILDNGKGSDRRILAKASGPVVQQAGGALQGMSGSPVYINGKLVGALSAGIKDMDPFTFLITPIGDMLKIWDMPDTKNITRIHQVDFREIERQKEMREKAEAAKKAEKTGKEDTVDVDVKPGKNKEFDLGADAAKAESTDAAKGESAAADEAKADVKPAKGDTESPAKPDFDDEDTDEETKAEPKATLYLGGFGEAGTRYMQRALGDLGYAAYRYAPFGVNAITGNVRRGAKLYPGSALGVAVVYGDFTVGATGTVTAVDGNRVLAFGHPFMHRGNVNFFMTDASVVGTVHGVSDGMKLANVGSIIGRVNQDRSSGISGTIGEFPSVVPVRVTVHDRSLGRDESFGAQIAYDEDFVPSLAAGIAYASMAKTSDNLGESTAKVFFSVSTNAVKDGIFSRDNMYYAPSDVGQNAVGEISQALSLITANTEQESDITDVKVDITVSAGRNTASIISVDPDKTTVKPGETIKFRTTIKPYRRDKETVFVPYTVPENQPEGPLQLDIRGGGFVPVTQEMLLKQSGLTVSKKEEEARKKTVADQIKDFLKTGKNNEIIVAPSQLQSQIDKKKAKIKAIENKLNGTEGAKKVDLLGKKAAEKADKTPGESKYATRYIIDNIIHTTLTVSKEG